MTFDEYKQARLGGQTPQQAYQGPDTSFSLGKTVGNIPSSAGNFLGGIASAIIHPVRTVKALGSVTAGGVEKLIPGRQAEEKSFDNLIDFYKGRYGSVDGLLSTVQKDPVGVLADAATVLSGGGAIASKLGTVSKLSTLEKVGATAANVGNKLNPLSTVGSLSSKAKQVFPALSKVIEKSNLRLTKTKEGALATTNVLDDSRMVDISKNRLNEVADYLSRQKIVGSPEERFAKATQLYQKTEDALDGFFSSFSKNSVVKKDRIVASLNGLKGVFNGHRDIASIKGQIDSAIDAVKAAPGDSVTYAWLNKFKRSTFENAYNRAGEKVVDGVEHSIGDTIRGMLDEDLRGLKIGGQSFEDFNHNYGLLIESRKLLKTAVGKPEISAITERVLGSMLGYLIGAAGGASSGGVGALAGLAAGRTLFEALPVTKLKSYVSAGARTIDNMKLPNVVRNAKVPLTATERVLEAQGQ